MKTILLKKHEKIEPINCDYIKSNNGICLLYDKKSKDYYGNLWWHGVFGNMLIRLYAGFTDKLVLYKRHKPFCTIKMR